MNLNGMEYIRRMRSCGMYVGGKEKEKESLTCSKCAMGANGGRCDGA